MINKLKYLEEKYNRTPTISMIQNEKDFPSKNTFVRWFGNINNAFNAAGYNIKPHKYNKEGAQKELDIRNGNFDIVSFNGCRDKSTIQCRKCKSVFMSPIYSLYDNTSESRGCPYCYNKIKQLYQVKNNIVLIHKGDKKNKYKCKKCNHIIYASTSYASSKKFHCSYCSKIDTKKYKLSKLLNDSLQTYYILGFLLSDGSFKNSNRLVFNLKSDDKDIVDKIAQYLNPLINTSYSGISYGFSCYDSHTIPILEKIYKIKHNKTYQPCDISNINGDKFIAFLIGFIDGDGCIDYRSDNNNLRITIKLYKAWCDNLNIFSIKLYHYFNVDKIPKAIIITTKENRQYATITFGNQKIINGLKKFIVDNNLFVLERKWGLVT